MEIKNLSFSFKSKEILRDVSLDIIDRVTTIIGLNGEGKTTFAKLIMGFLHSNDGEIIYEGKKVYCSSENILPPYVTINEIARSQKLSDYELDKMLDTFECAKYKNTFIKDLSFGTQKKMNLIVTFLQKCDLIILDEPSTGLDVISQIKLAEIIKNEIRQVILISHDFSLVKETSKKIFVLSNAVFTELNYEDDLQLKEKLQEISNSNE